MSATQKLLSKLSPLQESTDSEDREDVFAARLEWLTKVREELDENLISMNMDKPNAKLKKRDGKGAYTSGLKGKERKGDKKDKAPMGGQNYKRGPVRRESLDHLDWLDDVRLRLEAELSE